MINDEWKYTLNKEQRKRIEKNILPKFSEKQKKELEKIAKRIGKEIT